MGLIKSANAPTSLSPFSLKDVEEYARQILLKARKQAEQLLVEAQAEAEKIKAQAKEEGYKEGVRAGVAEGTVAGKKSGHDQALAQHNAALAALITTLTQITTQINSTRHQLDEEAGNSVTQLAISIARKATKLHGAHDPAVLNANVDSAARLVARSSDIRLAIHPSQKATLLDALPSLKMQWPSLAHVELVEDPAIAPGGCQIRTRSGLIDADLDRQIDQIAHDLIPSLSTV
jgi:flagellar assembly protein FliH